MFENLGGAANFTLKEKRQENMDWRHPSIVGCSHRMGETARMLNVQPVPY